MIHNLLNSILQNVVSRNDKMRKKNPQAAVVQMLYNYFKLSLMLHLEPPLFQPLVVVVVALLLS